MVVVGLSRSGKSCNFKQLYWPIHDKFRHTLIFSSTNDLNGEYDDIIKSSKSVVVKETYDDDLVKEVMLHQTDTIRKLKNKYGSFDKIPRKTKDKLHVSIITEDMLGLINFHNSVFNQLFSRSRHLCISIFIIQQHISTISPTMRINSHYLMVTKVKDNNIDTIYDLIVMDDIGCNKSDLRAFLNKYCVNYNCILFSELPFEDTMSKKTGKNRHYKVLHFNL